MTDSRRFYLRLSSWLLELDFLIHLGSDLSLLGASFPLKALKTEKKKISAHIHCLVINMAKNIS